MLISAYVVFVYRDLGVNDTFLFGGFLECGGCDGSNASIYYGITAD